jgi:tetratricopeptide (TPR) repeat protein
MVAAATVFGQSLAHAQEAAEGGGGGLIRDPAVQAAYENGVKLLAEQKYQQAVTEFNKALQPSREIPNATPDFPEAWVGKGDALAAMEDYQSAVVAYNQGIQYDQNSAAAYSGRGEVLLKARRADEAAADFARALELDPSNPRILSNLGHIMINFPPQDPVGAIRRLDDALAQNDQDARAYRDRGYAHALLQDFKAAEADLKRATEVDPEDYENFAMMANIYLFQNDFQRALDAITQAINAYKPKAPTDPKMYLSGYLSRADGWLRFAQETTDPEVKETAYRNVIADADAVINDNPDRFPQAGQAQYRKGRAQRMLKQYSEAVDSLTLALEGIPSGQEAEYVADAYMYRGICWYYIGSHDLARGDFEQASSVGGGFQDPRIFLWIGFTHHEQGDYRRALEAYNEAVSKAPKFALAHTNRGRAYMDLEEYDRAIESFNNAIRSEPGVGEHYYNVGFAYTQLDEFERAEHFLNIALRKENPQPKWYRLMATVLRERGRGELADEYERKAAAAPSEQAAGG